MTVGALLDTIVERTRETLRASFDLEDVSLPDDLVEAHGSYRGEPIALRASACRGGPLRYARFVRLEGASVSIANILCVPSPERSARVFGADLVFLGKESGTVVVDAGRPPHDGGLSGEAIVQRLTEYDLPRAQGWIDEAVALFSSSLDENGSPNEEIRHLHAAYCRAHRSDPRTSGLLGKAFGPAYAERYLNDVLFPPELLT